MRIIDADELLKGRTDHEMISTHLIFNAPTVDVLEQIQAEIYETFMTIDGGVHDKSALKCMEIIDKYR